MLKNFLIIAIINFWLTNAISKACFQELTQWVETFFIPVNKANERYSKMVRYSGRSLNDLGLFYECIAVEKSRYVIFQFYSFPAVVIGICFPDVCTKSDYWDVINKNFTIDSSSPLTQQTNFFFSGSHQNKFQRNSRKLLENQVQEVIFPQDFIHDNGNYSTGPILMITFLVGLLFLSLISTFYEFLKVKKMNNSLFSPMNQSSFFLDHDPEKIKIRSFVSPIEAQVLETFWEKLFFSFSLYSNTKKLFGISTFTKKDPLDSLNALKVISLLWICYGQTELYRVKNAVILNYDEINLYLTHLYFSIINNSTYALDTFFWISGLLQCYLLTSIFVSSPQSSKIFEFVLYRFFKFFPVYICILLISWCFAKYIGNGPRWYDAENSMHGDCENYFWSYFFMLNNFILPKNSNNCLVGSWYVPNVFQFFCVTFPVIYLYATKHRVFGWSILSVCTIFSMISCGVISYDEHFDVNFLKENDQRYLQDLYYKPYCRIGPYCIGVLTGFIFYAYKNRNSSENFDFLAYKIQNFIRTNQFFRIFGYVFGFFLINLLMWVDYNAFQSSSSWSRSQNSLYFTFQRTTWAIALSLIFLPMIMGHASILLPFLKSMWWNTTSKLVFPVYLLHMVIGQIYFFSQTTTYYFTQSNLIMDSLFIVALSFFIALPIVLIVEYPCKNIVKLICQHNFRKSSLEQ